MKPWFKWKGITSYEMGLVVESLPTITRPDMKTIITEIEGKDGDETEVLGYEAYDKEIIFGIKNTSEGYINELMDWLQGKGILITSIEPTKAYECRIYEGIDLQRLCRFRKGKVSFHTQPYKYAVSEEDIEWDGNEKKVTVTNTGNANALPVLHICGSGMINISLDDQHILKLDLGQEDEIIVDSKKQEAYDHLSLRNRAMMGNFVILSPGDHEITWDGDIETLKITPGSRWI